MLTRLTGAALLAPAIGNNPLGATLIAGTNVSERNVPPDQPLTVISVSGLEAAVNEKLTPGPFAYIHGGSSVEWTLAQTEQALSNLSLNPHRLAGFTKANLTTSFLGHTYPLHVNPMGAHDFAHPEAELASAQAAAAAGALFALSSAFE